MRICRIGMKENRNVNFRCLRKGQCLCKNRGTIARRNHRYIMLYRKEDDVVFADNIFHKLQNNQNKMY